MVTQADGGAEGNLSLAGAHLAGQLALEARVQTLLLTGFPSCWPSASVPGKDTSASISRGQSDDQPGKAAVR